MALLYLILWILSIISAAISTDVMLNDGVNMVEDGSMGHVTDPFNMFPATKSPAEVQTKPNSAGVKTFGDVMFLGEQLKHEEVEDNSITMTTKPTEVQDNTVPGNGKLKTNDTDAIDEAAAAKVSSQETLIKISIMGFGLWMNGIIRDQGENDTVLFSPLSIATLLTLLIGGMGKDSKTYIETSHLMGYRNDPASGYKFLYDDLDEEIIHLTYKKLASDLSNESNQITFKIGNHLFLQKDDNKTTGILKSYIKLAENYYNAGVQNLDFYGDPVGAVDIINNWVNDTTYGKIPKLITDPISPLTKFMAVNTLYFKAPWKFPFSTGDTTSQTFDTGREKIDIPFMVKLMGVKYIEQIDASFNASILELPYKGDRYNMYIIKPNGPANLESVIQLEDTLSPNGITELVSNVENSQVLLVWVEIPRMRLRYRAYLKDILEEMGASSMFSIKDADFSRISSDNQPILDNMIHEAVMDITEEGTEAAAATSTVVNRFGSSLSFVLDQPSLLFIYDNINKIPIFWARLVTPESI